MSPANSATHREKPPRFFKPSAHPIPGLLAIILFGIFGGLIIAELVLRIAGIGYNYDIPEMHFDVNDPHVGQWYKPNFHGRWLSDFHEFNTHPTFNSAGMRGAREYPPTPIAGSFRIALIGDSLVRGLEVEDDEVFSALLEKKLNANLERLAQTRFWHDKNAPQTAEVLNFGRSGSSPALEASILKFKVEPFHPRLVIQFLFPNDVPEDNLLLNGEHMAQVDSDGIVSRWRGLDVPPPLPFWVRVAKKTHLVNLLYRLWRYHRAVQALRAQGKESIFYGDLLHNRESDSARRLWRITEHFIHVSASFCKNHHIAYLLVILPFPPQVEKTSADYRGMNFEFRTRTILQSKAFQTHLIVFCKKEGIPCADFLPEFRKAKKAHPNERLFFNLDQHMTPLGHRLVTDFLTHLLFQPAPIRQVKPSLGKTSQTS